LISYCPELNRIRQNTQDILDGKFQTSAAGVAFYSTITEEGSIESSDPEQEKIANSEQRPFDGIEH